MVLIPNETYDQTARGDGELIVRDLDDDFYTNVDMKGEGDRGVRNREVVDVDTARPPSETGTITVDITPETTPTRGTSQLDEIRSIDYNITRIGELERELALLIRDNNELTTKKKTLRTQIEKEEKDKCEGRISDLKEEADEQYKQQKNEYKAKVLEKFTERKKQIKAEGARECDEAKEKLKQETIAIEEQKCQTLINEKEKKLEDFAELVLKAREQKVQKQQKLLQKIADLKKNTKVIQPTKTRAKRSEGAFLGNRLKTEVVEDISVYAICSTIHRVTILPFRIGSKLFDQYKFVIKK